MKYVNLGKTELKVSRLGFGCIKFKKESQDTVTEALNEALDQGVNFFDTARAYGPSEEMIGKAISNRRSEFFIATKTGELTYEGAREEVKESLAKLNTDYIDIYQLHNPSTDEKWEKATDPAGAYKALTEAKNNGEIGHVGITLHRSLDKMREAISSGRFETIMLYYNPVDEENVGKTILPMASEAGMGVIAMKALSGGKFCLPEALRTQDKDPIVEKSLRFVLSNPHIDVVIPGMRNSTELHENIETEQRPALSEKEYKELLGEIHSVRKTFRYNQQCMQCDYCQPCPEGIEIPTILRSIAYLSSENEVLEKEAKKLLSTIKKGPENCIECEKCVEACPAEINIPEILKNNSEIFTKNWVGKGSSL